MLHNSHLPPPRESRLPRLRELKRQRQLPARVVGFNVVGADEHKALAIVQCRNEWRARIAREAEADEEVKLVIQILHKQPRVRFH